MGKPPALYYLYKMGIQDNFHYTDTSLYTSQFYRAVKVGNTELLNTLESGFDKISDQEMESINARWLGISSLPSFWAENFRFILFWVSSESSYSLDFFTGTGPSIAR